MGRRIALLRSVPPAVPRGPTRFDGSGDAAITEVVSAPPSPDIASGKTAVLASGIVLGGFQMTDRSKVGLLDLQ
jgi:hypothetical protein